MAWYDEDTEQLRQQERLADKLRREEPEYLENAAKARVLRRIGAGKTRTGKHSDDYRGSWTSLEGAGTLTGTAAAAAEVEMAEATEIPDSDGESSKIPKFTHPENRYSAPVFR